MSTLDERLVSLTLAVKAKFAALQVAATALTVKGQGSALGSTFSTLNFVGAAVATTDAGGGQANITVTASSSSETIYLKDHGIVADGVTVNSAAAVEALITASTNGCLIHEPLGPWKIDRPIKPSKTVSVVGYGGAKGQSGGAGRSQAIAPAGYPAWIFLPAAQQSSITSTKISQTSLLATVGTASYAGGTATTITGNTLLDIQNDMVIWLEGAGGSLVIPGRTFAVGSGSNSVTATSSGSYGNYWSYVGQMVSIAGAGAAGAALVGYIGTIGVGGNFTLVDAAGAALNASTTVTVALVTAFAPLQTRVVSGGGTATLTIDAYPEASLAVTGAKIRHAAPAIYSTTQIHTRNVEVGGDCQGGLTLAGITTGGNVADGCTSVNCMWAADLFGVSFQGNDAQVNRFFGDDFAGPKVGVLDNSFLGNYFFACHFAFNCGLLSFNAFVQIIGGYFEANTGWAALGGMFYGTMSLVNGAGLKGFAPEGDFVQGPALDLQGPLKAKENGTGDPAGHLLGQVVIEDAPAGVSSLGNYLSVTSGGAASGNRFRVFMNGASGMYLTGATSVFLNAETGNLQMRLADATMGSWETYGLNLAAGKVLKLNGTTVIDSAMNISAVAGTFSGALSATNLSGTNTGDQTITLTGNVTGSGTGSFATTIAAGAVTLAMQANMATASLVYRKTAGAGAPEVNTLATLKTDLGLTGTNSGDQTITLTSDVTGSGTGSFATTIAAGAVTLAKMANLAANSIIGNNTGSPATPIALTAAQAKTLLAIGESDVTNLTTDLAAKSPLASPVFTGNVFLPQPSPTAVNATATLTIAQLLTVIITCTSTVAVTMTLPTGTLTDAGILSGALATNEGFEWSIINTGSSSGAITVSAGTAHTIVGGATVAIGVSSRWFTRKTATNTFVTYRLA